QFCRICIQQLCENKFFIYFLAFQRALSAAEAVNALRPFYFAVHPDFFGQFPREREVNENSLKQLNGYMENLQKPDLKLVRPIKLTFYIRDTKESSEKQPGFVSSGTQKQGGNYEQQLHRLD
uniref:DUF4460 domain-containing protein n=1 Tax=Xiphophorus couchianus TaxID=32473 RepID=A0A3B5MDA2_9TELE